MQTTLKGVLERIIFYNEDNHFTIGELRPEKSRGMVTITGNLPSVQCGETLSLQGQWTNHPIHGQQFKVEQHTSELPATVYGIRKYLGSGLIPNIGPKYAEKIVDKFGTETLQVISQDSGRLKEVPGVGAKRAKDIKRAWDEQSALRDVMVFLQTYGVSTAQCLRLIRTYGNGAKAVLENEPYKVAREIRGIGFKTADKIAVNLGYSNESPPRLEAGLLHALQEQETQGHTAYPREKLEAYASELLTTGLDLMPPRVEALIDKGELIATPHDLIQLPNSERAERVIAHSIHRLQHQASRLPSIIIDKAIIWAQDKAGFIFAEQQAAGVRAALESKVSIITGGPGTGKTTILRALVDILKVKKVKLHLAAPTGRAAQRMNETTGAYAQTIHRMLKFDAAESTFSTNENNPLSTQFLIVDEASMLDSKLAAALFRAVPAHAHLVLVGDIFQLPSVGAGNVLKDLIHYAQEHQALNLPVARTLRVTKLDTIFRQQQRSNIVTVAHSILKGNAGAPAVVEDLRAIDPQQDLHFIKQDTAEACVAAILQLTKTYIPRLFPSMDPYMDVQVLPPMHKGVGGIHNLNIKLQDHLNPNQRGVSIGSTRYQVGDKLIQTRNNYDKGIFNGDLGRVTNVNPDAGTLAAEFDGVVHDFERTELIDLQLAYAISIHKSQGSEFPIVIIPLLKQHYVMLQRNLLYTGITRGRRKVFIVGDPTAYAMAVRNQEATLRITDLIEKLKSRSPERS